MPADQAAGSASILLLLFLGLMAAGAGIGIMMGVGGKSGNSGEGGSSMNVGKIVTFLVVGLVLATWLAAPGTGHGIAAVINAMWGNLVIGLQPLVAIVTQLAMIAVISIVGFYAVRHFIRRH
jgi:hypothetical protein